MSEQKRIDNLTRRQAIAIMGATGIITITGCGTDVMTNPGVPASGMTRNPAIPVIFLTRYFRLFGRDS